MKSRHAGFTLIELLLVVVIIALASSLATLALRDPAATRLEHEAARLAALLEGARAEARSSGLSAYWEPKPAQAGVEGSAAEGFRFEGLPASSDMPTGWLVEGVTAEVVGARAVLLGPEPLIGAHTIVLRLDDKQLILSTDGLGPFVVSNDEPQAVR